MMIVQKSEKKSQILTWEWKNYFLIVNWDKLTRNFLEGNKRSLSHQGHWEQSCLLPEVTEEETVAGRAKRWAVGSRERGGEQQAVGLGTQPVAQLCSTKKRGERERADLWRLFSATKHSAGEIQRVLKPTSTMLSVTSTLEEKNLAK